MLQWTQLSPAVRARIQLPINAICGVPVLTVWGIIVQLAVLFEEKKNWEKKGRASHFPWAWLTSCRLTWIVLPAQGANEQHPQLWLGLWPNSSAACVSLGEFCVWGQLAEASVSSVYPWVISDHLCPVINRPFHSQLSCSSPLFPVSVGFTVHDREVELLLLPFCFFFPLEFKWQKLGEAILLSRAKESCGDVG